MPAEVSPAPAPAQADSAPHPPRAEIAARVRRRPIAAAAIFAILLSVGAAFALRRAKTPPAAPAAPAASAPNVAGAQTAPTAPPLTTLAPISPLSPLSATAPASDPGAAFGGLGGSFERGALSPAGAAPSAAGAGMTTAGALDAARERVRAHPGDIAARVQLAALLDTSGDPSQAEDVLREALQRGQKSPEIFHALGVLYSHHEQYSGAMEAYRAELMFRPKNALAHLSLAQACAYAYKSEDAEREFKAALKLDPSLADAYLGLAFLNNSSERYQYAVKYLQQYVRLARDPGPGYGLLSRIYLNMRLYDEAVEAGRKATAAMPTSGSCWYNLGQACSYRPGAQSLADAAGAFERAALLTPNSGHVHFELGFVYARQKRYPEAIAQYREAVRCEPTYGKYHYQLGRLLLLQHQDDEGKKEVALAQPLIALNQRQSQLQDKIAVAPRDPRNFLELGQVCVKLGDRQQAAKCFQAVLTLDPANAAARQQLAQLGPAGAAPESAAATGVP